MQNQLTKANCKTCGCKFKVFGFFEVEKVLHSEGTVYYLVYIILPGHKVFPFRKICNYYGWLDKKRWKFNLKRRVSITWTLCNIYPKLTLKLFDQHILRYTFWIYLFIRLLHFPSHAA